MAKQTWKIDPAHSGVHFTVRHMVFAKVRGAFTGFEGSIELDPDSPSDARVAAKIDAASIDTREPKRD